MDFKKEKQSQFRPRLTRDQIKLLFVTYIHNDDVFNLVRSQVTAGTFNQYEQDFASFLFVYNWYYDQHKSKPDYKLMYLTVEQVLGSGLLVLSTEATTALLTLVTELYSYSTDYALDTETAKFYLRDFLMERVADTTADRLSRSNLVSNDLSTVYQDGLNRLSQIQTICAKRVPPAFITGWNSETFDCIPCGVDYLDNFLDGGVLPGEIYGLFGTYGGCKTITAIQVSVNLASYYRQQWEIRGCRGPLGVVYFFNYELSRRILMVRAISHAAQITNDKLMHNIPLANNIEESADDQERFSIMLDSGLYVASESVRRQAAENMLNCNWRLVDFSGSDQETRSFGTGYIQEIQSVIKNDIQSAAQEGKEIFCAGVVVDYVSAMVRRHLSVSCNQKSRDYQYDERRLNADAPLNSGIYIAKEFECPVFLIQQLNADANQQDVSRATNHTQASLARTFGENCDFCFCYGVPDKDQRCVVDMTKTRRAAPKDVDIVQIVGKYYSVYSVGHEYYADTKKKAILEREVPLKPIWTSKQKFVPIPREELNDLNMSGFDDL